MYGKRKQSFLQTRAGFLTVLAVVGFIFFVYHYAGNSGDTTSLDSAASLERHARSDGSDASCDEGPIQILSWSPRVFLYRNFINEQQCKYLIDLGEKQGLERSRVVSNDEFSSGRTSTGKFISTDGDPLIMEMEKRIADWTMIPVENGESFYMLKYETGQEYQPHHDYFEGDLGMKHVEVGGQRTVTVIVYLASPELGGETVFPLADLTIQPRAGDALLFHSHLPNGQLDPKTLHGSNPVISGTKYCFTKWIRQRPYDYNWYLMREKQTA